MSIPWSFICPTVVVGLFFTSMSVMEGKGVSGVVDGLSTVRLLSHLSIQPVLTYLDVCANSVARLVCSTHSFVLLNRLAPLRL